MNEHPTAAPAPQPPNFPARSSPDFRSIVDQVFTGEEAARYTAAISLIQQLAPQIPTWGGVDFNSPRSILSRFISFRASREDMIAALAIHAREKGLSSDEIIEFLQPISDLIALTQPLVDKNQARYISNVFADPKLVDYIDQQPLAVEKHKLRELKGPGDRIDYYLVGEPSPEKAAAAMRAFDRSWITIIGCDQAKRCQVLLLECCCWSQQQSFQDRWHICPKRPWWS